MDKRLIIIGIQEENLVFITEQIKHIIGEFIKIKSITIKDLHYGTIGPHDVVLLSGDVLRELVQPFLSPSCTCMIAKREVNVVNLEEMMKLPAGQHILVVNDHSTDTIETVFSLEQILGEHTYYPYVPNQPLPEIIDYVVTPGEKHLVPKAFRTIIDIGPRVISFETLEDILHHFDLDVSHSVLMNKYIKALVLVSKKSAKSTPVPFEDQNQDRTFAHFVTNSPIMKETVDIARKIASTLLPIHIEGETGVGKKLMAEAIHNESPFQNGLFFTYNCAGKVEELLAVELFGKDEEGKSMQGIVEAANGGTLFLKNLEYLSYDLQGKLLQVLEAKEIQRVNGEATIPVHLRLITSTSLRLSELLEAGKIRTELYSYISPYMIRMPTLQERTADLEALIEMFKMQFQKKELTFSPEVMEVFYKYSWPGNVRELFNVVSYCACTQASLIELKSLPLYFRGHDALEQQQDRDLDEKTIIATIEGHGFLNESIGILEIFKAGKEQHVAYGRTKLIKLLSAKGIHLTDQQLRLRLDILKQLNLLNVRQGRAGTTISVKGEQFLHKVLSSAEKS
ncbi:sigma 54-interacting transcriptional regulator [Brevibacillus panacihumi]|uniref:Sigma-54-dependent Fis family transcriptional regulator n=1 Tax=Brevibacillus panacihumi TaxID=497735 RepID=A0A3M8CRN9_9BACL|nr:sigma 54-interacting transcriptional regulator [Brevibacillus panacihumi]RNB77535.1 sigma-54-dependent Fis family transcriptional regulator [Brevibacillus panacihumi]